MKHKFIRFKIFKYEIRIDLFHPYWLGITYKIDDGIMDIMITVFGIAKQKLPF